MIKVNELRIGNLVSNGEKNYTVDANMIYDAATMGEHYKLFPIPLTPEILEVCGFELAYLSTHEGVIIMKLKTKDVIGIQLCLEYHSKFNNSIHVSYVNKDDGIVFPCTSLHQLQNLYYCLTGEELQYKLSSEQNAQECDTTDDDSSNADDNIKK